jgi:hypothetical protein
MNRRVFALIAFCLLAMGCSGQQSSGKGATMSNTVTTQAELNEGNQRINEFKQELLRRGFRVVSSFSSESKEQVILEGRYGALKDLEVTLWTGNRLETKEPQLGGGIHASIAGKEAEQEFDEFYKRVVKVVVGEQP